MSDLPRILVVDDHSEIRKSVTSYLERNGMRASAAENAVEMDARLAEAHFDLIVLDVMMPGMSGLDVLASLRKKWSQHELPVLFLTARGTENDMTEGFAVDLLHFRIAQNKDHTKYDPYKMKGSGKVKG